MSGLNNRPRTGRSVWQVSGGPVHASYAEVFLRYGVALIGPGDGGTWAAERYAYDFSLQGYVRRFAEEVSEGDILLLRSGGATVVAVGIVASDYLYLDAFDDVNGWDLQHARQVRWCRLDPPHVFSNAVFGASPTRISKVSQSDAQDFAERFVGSPPTHWHTARLPELPAEDPPLQHPPEGLRDLVALVADMVPLVQSRVEFGEASSEDEMIVHFVVPFLKALGWPPELIAVKWRWVDVALFRALPRTPEHCQVVIEAKRLGAGVEGALDQARGYVETLGHGADVVVTDGVRYRMYDGKRDFEHVAYANLAKLKEPATELFDRLKRP